MSGQSPELGKGFLGYRRSAVDQILAERDGMLRRAEGRVRSGELKVAELGRDLASAAERNARLEEQIERLRAQLDTLTERSVEVDRVWRELQAQMDSLAAWRDRAESMMGSFRSALEEFRLWLEEIPDQVRQALSASACTSRARRSISASSPLALAWATSTMRAAACSAATKTLASSSLADPAVRSPAGPPACTVGSSGPGAPGIAHACSVRW